MADGNQDDTLYGNFDSYQNTFSSYNYDADHSFFYDGADDGVIRHDCAFMAAYLCGMPLMSLLNLLFETPS